MDEQKNEGAKKKKGFEHHCLESECKCVFVAHFRSSGKILTFIN